MKKYLIQLSGVALVFSLILFTTCKTDDPEPEGGGTWTEADKQSHDEVISIQDEIGDNLDDWFQSMDSVDAVQTAYQAFLNSEKVSSATMNSQGIAVQYSNGMRGGLFLNPKDDKGEVGEPMLFGPAGGEGNNLKSLVNQKKMILLNPHYWERSYYTDQVYNLNTSNLSKVNINIPAYYKDEAASVERFTQLSGYGIVQIYSHGWAWPKQDNITDVYCLTGEEVNEATSKKYWDDVKTGNIPIVKTVYHSALRKNVYLVSESFVSKHNDFSNDTILFYGSFCYSFLGDWPDIIDEFADGAYLGHDWSVYTHKNANWVVNSVFNLSDTSASQPITLNDWFNNTEVPKSYWNERDKRTVHLMYTGDGNLKLWDKEGVSLIALSSDGKPVSEPGEPDVGYQFKCVVNSSVTNREYLWDIGDGTSPVTTQGNVVEITWGEAGNYLLQVSAINKDNGSVIGKASLNVTIGNQSNEIIDILKQCDYTVVYLNGTGAINHWNFTDCSWTVDGLLNWNGLNFSGSSEMNGLTKTITGTVSSSGQSISFTVTKEGEILGYNMQVKIALTVENYPLSSYQYNSVEYMVDPPGGTSYVTNLEGYITVDGETEVLSASDFNWGSLDEFRIYFTKPN